VFDAELMFPDAVLSLASQVNADVGRLNASIQASAATKQGQFRNNWHTFVNEWAAFFRHLSDDWIARAQTANIDTLKDYQSSKLPAWEAKLRELDAATAADGPGVKPRETPKGLDLGGTLGKAAWVVGGALALYLAWTFAPVVAKAIGK
jgi:hypothetical protein